MAKAEDKIELELKTSIEKKKLSSKKVKDFIKRYYDGDPTMTCPVGCKATCQEECYIEIHKALVSDEGKQQAFQTLYNRFGEKHCCGKLTQKLERGTNYCTVCGKEHK